MIAKKLTFGLALGLAACAPSYGKLPDAVLPQATELGRPPMPTLHQFHSLSLSQQVDYMTASVVAMREADEHFAKLWLQAKEDDAFAIASQRALSWLEHVKGREDVAIFGRANAERGSRWFKVGFVTGYRRSLRDDVPEQLTEAWGQCADVAVSEAERTWCVALQSEILGFDADYADALWECSLVQRAPRRSDLLLPQVLEDFRVLCPSGEMLEWKNAPALQLMRACVAPEVYVAARLAGYARQLEEQARSAEAISLYETALERQPGDLDIMNALARTLATGRDTQLRDPARARPYVDYLLDTREDQAAYWDTAAAVYAALGKFGRARQFERQALKYARAEEREDFLRALHSYEQHQQAER